MFSIRAGELLQKDDAECKDIVRALAGEEVAQSIRNGANQYMEMDGVLYHEDNRKIFVGPFRVRGSKGMMLELEDNKGVRLKVG